MHNYLIVLLITESGSTYIVSVRSFNQYGESIAVFSVAKTKTTDGMCTFHNIVFCRTTIIQVYIIRVWTLGHYQVVHHSILYMACPGLKKYIILIKMICH